MASPAVACSTANCFAVAIPPSGYAGVPQGGMRPPLRSVRCLPVVALLLPYGTAPDGAFTRRRAEQRTLPGGTCSIIHCLFAPSRPWCGGWKIWVRPTSLKVGRQERFTPFFAPLVPLFRTSDALWVIECRRMEEVGGGAWKTRGRPWPRERVDGACARRDGAKRKVFQVPPPTSGSKREKRRERGRGWKVIWAEPLVITLFTPSRGLERQSGF